MHNYRKHIPTTWQIIMKWSSHVATAWEKSWYIAPPEVPSVSLPVKEAKCKSLHTACFHLCDILEKANYRDREADRWLPGSGDWEKGFNYQKEFLGWWKWVIFDSGSDPLTVWVHKDSYRIFNTFKKRCNKVCHKWILMLLSVFLWIWGS